MGRQLLGTTRIVILPCIIWPINYINYYLFVTVIYSGVICEIPFLLPTKWILLYQGKMMYVCIVQDQRFSNFLARLTHFSHAHHIQY